MKKLRMSKFADKKAVIKLEKANKLEIKFVERNNRNFLLVVFINDKFQIEELVKKLQKKNIRQVIIENLDLILENKMDKLEIINRFTVANIKCLDLQTGYNNYIEGNRLSSTNLYNMLHKDKNKLQKNKKTVAYMSFKELDSNNKAKLYITKLAEKDIRKYANENNLKISTIYIDYIPSRLNLKNRESLNKLMNRIEEDYIGQILIPRMEHLSRNMEVATNIINEINKRGARIIFCNS